MGNKITKYLFLFTLFVSFAGSPFGYAQKLLFRLDGSEPEEVFGSFVTGIGDIDGDSVPDLAISAPLARRGKLHPNGEVIIYSGATGAELLRLDPIELRGLFGWSVADVGDLDGDGVPDILVGAPYTTPKFMFGAGSVLVHSGATGEVLFILNGEEGGNFLGWSVAGLGDINADGKPDFIVGAPYASSADGRLGVGTATVISGLDWKTLFKFEGNDSGDFLGWSVAHVDDIDGDGVSDMVLGAPSTSLPNRPQAGSVYIRSGATGNLIRRIDGLEAGDHLGSSIAGTGALGAHTPDIIVGAPNASPNGLEKAGSVFVFSGRTGNIIFRFDGPEPFAEFGASVANAGDVDGDGVPDIIVGAPGANPNGLEESGSAFVFSGATGHLIFRFDGAEQGNKLGFSVSNAGSLSGDGRSNVIIGAPYASPKGLYGAGTAFVLQ